METDFQEQLKQLRKLQIAEIDLVHLFWEICEKERLTYFMLGGTMLGAVRHKGFIPWDDDIDFGMPRPDYEKFLRVADKYLPQGYHLLNERTTKEYFYYIPRLTCSKTKVKCELYQEERIEDVSIDIFALDGMPDKKLWQYVHEWRMLALHALYKFSVFDRYVSVNNPNRTWYEKALVFLCKHLSLQRLFSPRKRLDARDRLSRKYPYEESNTIMNFMGAYKLKEMFPKSVFGDGRLYDFEGMRLRGPQDYDFYLTQLYGEYMEPPKTLDIGKHAFKVLEENENG